MVKDWAYAATFKQEDLPSLQDMVRQINQTHNIGIIEDLNDRLERRDSHLASGVQIQRVTKSDDLIVTVGMEQCIKLSLALATTRFKYMVWGSAPAPGAPQITDTEATLIPVPEASIDMSGLEGWREAAGMKLYFGGIRSQTRSAPLYDPLYDDVKELGVMTTNNTPGSVLLNHSVFSQRPISPGPSGDLTVGTMVIVLSAVVEFCPVA